MKSVVQTRIFVSLSPEEARAAVNNAVDLQLCVRSALYQIDVAPVAHLIEQNRRQLPAPKKAGRGKVKRVVKIAHTCPTCNKGFVKRGNLLKHVERDHSGAGVEPAVAVE